MKYRIIKRKRFTIERGFEEEFEPQKKGVLWPFWSAVLYEYIDMSGGVAPVTFSTIEKAKEVIQKSKKSYEWTEEIIKPL